MQGQLHVGKDRVNIGGREQANIDSAFAKLNSDHYFDKKKHFEQLCTVAGVAPEVQAAGDQWGICLFADQTSNFDVG